MFEGTKVTLTKIENGILFEHQGRITGCRPHEALDSAALALGEEITIFSAEEVLNQQIREAKLAGDNRELKKEISLLNDKIKAQQEAGEALLRDVTRGTIKQEELLAEIHQRDSVIEELRVKAKPRKR